MQTLPKLNTHILGINVSPEMQLLLCCASTQIDAAKTEQIKSLIQQANLDWQKITSSAWKHGLMPLLYTNLNAIASDTVPKDVLNQLRNLFYTNAQRSLMLTGELVQLLRLLQENGISAVPYKGPVLANLLYGNIGLRQFCDLDILVQQQDVLKFKTLLMSRGYRPKVQLTEAEEINYLKDKSKHTYNLINDSKGIMVEIHWRITPRYTSAIEVKYVWENLHSSSLGGMKIYTFSAEDWLLLLSNHASRHRWEKLSWLADIAELLRQNTEINWERVIQKANDFDCRRMLFLGLFLTRQLIGINLPTEVINKINNDQKVTKLASEISLDILSQNNTNQKFMQNTRYHIQVRERLQNKILYLELFWRWLIRDKSVLLDE
ncbi:nucleotidyltransferase family protein [Pelatocladus sp. BLCC-F211]|uniref:nucleotidyltransferase domain-containing protein n=1 Tax=Pelatocladus sp. BLCC-F211 TaxID=3342752 RepID=UPI0035B962B8